MGEAILRYLPVALIILVACHEVDTTEGRKIKALNQHFWIYKDTTLDGNVPLSAEEMAVNAISNKDTNGDVSAYRPTTPGNSPGVGHRKSGEDLKAKKVAVQSPSQVEYSLAEGSKTDFRRTDPSHSPGVGHVDHHHQNKSNGEVGQLQNQLGN